GFSIHDALTKPIDPDRLLESLTLAGVAPEAQGTILVVDADPASLGQVDAALVRLGYRARLVADAEGALAAVADAQAPPLAIVLGLVIPGMTAFEFLARAAGGGGLDGVPVVLCAPKNLAPEDECVLEKSAPQVVDRAPWRLGPLVAHVLARAGRH